MPITLLLDLDDTLLETNTEAFLPAYYRALADHLSPLVPPERLLAALASGIKCMRSNLDPSKTLQAVFDDDFYPRLGVPKADLQDPIDEFYTSVFPKLKTATRTRAGAQELVSWAVAQGHELVVATDPVFPRTATLQRVEWAGLDPDNFALISTFETFHFTKDHAAYMAEILGRLGWPDRPVLMAGNDTERDVAPARAMAMPTYLVHAAAAPSSPRKGPGTSTSGAEMEGDLAALKSWLEVGQLGPYVPPLRSRDAVLDMLRATPAALEGLTLELSRSMWVEEPSKEDWAMIELVCHLRDTESEVHHAQLAALLTEAAPFVPRPDAAVWAKQRRYLSEDGPTAITQLAKARIETLSRLEQLPDLTWSKPARHAIFGPTTFGEVIGFMADHDRMHLQQARNTLAALDAHAHRK